MSDNKKLDPGKIVILVVVLIASVLVIAVSQLVSKSKGTVSTPTPISSSQPVSSPIPPTDSTPPTLPPALPDPLTPSTWHDDSSDCSSEKHDQWVWVSGLDIYGGIPPYKIKFEQFNKPLTEVLVSPDGGRVNFDPPILVNKGSYVQVTITSNTTNGEPSWNSGIFYLLNPICEKKQP